MPKKLIQLITASFNVFFQENFKINKCAKINFHFGTIDTIKSKNYDNILVNIEKNIIVNKAKFYCNKN